MNFDLPFSDAPDSEGPVIPELSDALLGELFAAAKATLKVEPWKILHDTDWFGIVDPDTGETHVVAIMGAAKQLYAVQVYLPAEGIYFWNDFIHKGEPDIALGQYCQRTVSCEFVCWNEDDLDETDMARNERFGEAAEGAGDLDSFLFRSTLPGCVNWHPTEDEARKILDALRLVPRFLNQKKKLPQKCYDTEFGDTMPWIPCYRLPENKDRRQAADWRLATVRFPEAECPETYLPDELFPNRVDSHPTREGEIWQIGSFYLGKAVMVDGRPVWLLFYLVVSEQSDLALGTGLLPCTDAREVGLRKSFLKAVSEVGHRPETLKVGSDLAEKVFRDVPGLTVVRQDRLPELEHVSADLMANHGIFSEDGPLGGLSNEAMEEIDSIMADFPPLGQLTQDELAEIVGRISEVKGGNEFLQAMTGQAEAAKSETGAVETGERFIFRIDLEGLRPPIWRRLSISTGATFGDLHDAIQDLFDWDGDHLHSFLKRQGRRVTLSIGPDPEHDDQSEHTTTLKSVFKRKGSKIHYVYDFGDNWSHLIKLEEKVKSKAGETGPACLAGRGIAPPEDCGGIWGFLELLDPESGYAEELEWDPEHLRHLREGKFEPERVVFRRTRRSPFTS